MANNPYDTSGNVDLGNASAASAYPAANAANAEQNGTNPLSGFASRYNPNQLENIWQSPWTILKDIFPNMNMAGPGYQGLRDIGADPLTLYNLMAGQNNDLSAGGTGGYANWLADLYKSLGTKGGRGFSGKELLQSLFNPVGAEAGSGSTAPNSALYNILTAGDGATQMRTLFNMARDATNVGLNPLAARGYQSALARAGDQAMNQQMNASSGADVNSMPIFQLLRQIAPGLVPG